ncbi:Sua5/YciO/YrdC/YwlC family protein, partial [Streptococcus suis]
MNLNICDFETILKYSKNQPTYLKQLYDAFLPGPLTIILEASQEVPDWINSGLSSVGFRMPKHPVTLDMIANHGPLIGPS